MIDGCAFGIPQVQALEEEPGISTFPIFRHSSIPFGMNIHWIQHVEFEGLGYIDPWLEENGHTVACTRLWAGDDFPDIGKTDGLIVMGGPMGITDHDEFPWLVPEKEFIKAVIDADKPVLGICLGAQLIAGVLGSNVWKNEHKEIGFFPLETKAREADASVAATERSEEAILGKQLRCGTALRDAWASFFPDIGSANLKSGNAGSRHWKNQPVFHWHGDTFGIPEGAVRLASSAATENQAFLYKDNVLALQFHLETTEESLLKLYENAQDEICDAPFIQTLEEMRPFFPTLGKANELMAAALEKLFN